MDFGFASRARAPEMTANGMKPKPHPTGAAAEKTLAVPARLELATFGLGNRCSIRLSYGTR